MSAGMFLAGLGSGAAQGYMMRKMIDREDAKSGASKIPAPVSDAKVTPVADLKPESTPPVASAATPPTESAATPPTTRRRKVTGSAITADSLAEQDEEYRNAWGTE